MQESWRWYGDLDTISLPEIRQTGATGIVTALHEIPYGQVWPRGTIAQRRDRIRAAGMEWVVCESLPLHEDIKRGTGDLTHLFAAYRQSLANMAAEGIHTICYNFMPLIDWTRTDLTAPVSGGGSCLRFEATKMAAFELHMLGRQGAADEYPPDVLENAAQWFAASTQADRDALLNAIMCGLPGAYDRYDIDSLRGALATYDGLTKSDIRANYQRFLDEVIPTADELGMRLCVHPDDPPRDILGLPRIVSNADDIDWVMAAYASPANGLTLCTGSLGAGPGNDPVAIAETHASRIHFVHLRNVRKDPDGSFEEAAHLDGDTDMTGIARVLLAEEKRRVAEGRTDTTLPWRPDHGHALLSDADRQSFPGYPLIGRMRGLAELRGVLHAVQAMTS
jgi:mannonate dehydratase